jgi:hypothetical protein
MVLSFLYKPSVLEFSVFFFFGFFFFLVFSPAVQLFAPRSMPNRPAQATAVRRGSSDLRFNFEKGRKKGEKKKKVL